MKAPYLAVLLVVLSVGGVVMLGGVTKQQELAGPRIAAAKLDPAAASGAEAPPFPPLDGPVWNLPSVDARISIPKGWSIGRVGNDERLLRREGEPLAGNMNLILMPNAFGYSVDELLRENVEELAVNPDLHLEDRQELYVMGRKVLRFDYNGVPRNGGEPVRFVAIIWPRGRYQVALTLTVRAKDWGELAEAVDASFRSLQIRWPVARRK
jgi:hypothetical protein